MAVVLRLTRKGHANRAHYRVVAATKTACRDGSFLEVVGNVDPIQNPAIVNLKQDRINYWLSVGAVPSATVRAMIEKQFPGTVTTREKAQRAKIVEARRKRKARMAKSGSTKKTAAKK